MRRVKKVLAAILTIIMCISLCTVSVRAEGGNPVAENGDSEEVVTSEVKSEMNSEMQEDLENLDFEDLFAGSNPYDPNATNPDGTWANCTYWCWKLVYDNTGIALNSWGHAGSWYSRAQSEGYTCNNTPSANSIAVWLSGNYGHVAYVTAVSGNQIYIKEGGYRTSANGFHEGWHTTSDVYGYIHLSGGGGGTEGQEMTNGYDRLLPDGDYIIATAGSTDKTNLLYLDIYGSTYPAADPTNVCVCYTNNPLTIAEYEIWTIKYQDGFYKITQKGTNMALDVQDYSRANGANVLVSTSHSGSNQKWAISRNERNGYRIQAKNSGYSLDIANAIFQTGTNVQMCISNNTDAQSWIFVPYKPSQPVKTGKYMLVSALNNNYIMDVSGETGDIPNCQNVQLWQDNTQNKYNEFEVVPLSNGYYKLIHVASGKALEVTEGISNIRANIALYDDNGSIAQQWAIIPNGSGYMLVSRCSGMAADVQDGIVSNGTNINLCYRNNSDAETWKFVNGEYLIGYNMNGGTGSIASQTKYYKNDLKLTTTIPTYEGKEFLGWSRNQSATTAEYLSGATYTLDQSVILYAVWKDLLINPVAISLDKKTATLTIGEELTLNPTFLPLTTTEKNITWTSSKPSVATVENGVVKAVDKGETIITAKTVNNLTATCKITVSGINPEIISLNKTTGTLTIGEEMTLIASLTPDNVTEKDITWTSSKPGVATVENGVVKAKGKGVTTITAKTVNDLTATCKITVYGINPETISLNKPTGTLTVGEDLTLTASLTPDNVTETTITWTSSKPEVATVENGVVKGIGKGVTIITAKTVNNLTATCKITVYGISPETISLNKTSESLIIGEETTLIASLTPDNVTEKTIIWTSSNPEVASVEDGIVTAISSGVTTITAKTVNDLTATCEVTVIGILPESISLDITSATLVYGEGIKLTSTLTPSNVTEKTIEWTSSNEKVAIVSNGYVKATHNAGTTIITAKTVNGLTAECEIIVQIDNNPENIFADIKFDSWQYRAVRPVYDKGYMTGKGMIGDKVWFAPNDGINRSQFAVALYSIAGKPEVTYEQKFSDVKEGAWYANAVTWAEQNGIVAGNADGSFGINGKATREQMALMFYKYAVYCKYNVDVDSNVTLETFTDANTVHDWALPAVKWAVSRGIISGKGNAESGYRIDPTAGATRAECAAMMNKFSEIYANAPKMGTEDLEEPLALPEEEIEDLPIPADETEDVIIDEDEKEKDEDVPLDDEKEAEEEEINYEENSEVE